MINYHFKRIKLVAFVLLVSVNLFSQTGEIPVNGKVVNSSGEPVANVAITFFGSSVAPVISDETGNFSLTVPNGNVWLSISPVGEYKEKSIYLNARESLTVVLVKDGEQSQYDLIDFDGHTVTKRDLVARTYTEENADPFISTVETFDQNLQGQVSGLHQTGMSGMPGSGTYMLLRGLNSINTSNQPLIIIDGMPLENPRVISSTVSGYSYNPASTLDPTDISNLTIVKDGAALTTYGIKGANGLILIETLKPVETNTSIDFRYKAGMSLAGKELPQLGAYDYKTLAKEVLSSSPIREELYAEMFPGLYYTPDDEEFIRYDHDMNWQNEVFKNSVVQDAYISVKGGDAIARYGLSLGYLNHDGIITNTNYNRISTRFVGTFNIFSGLRMYVSANLVSTSSHYKESALGEQTSPILSSLHKSPQMFPKSYDQDGQLLEIIDDIDELGVSNPTATVNSYSAKNSNYRFLTSFRAEGDLSPNLKLNSTLGLNINDLKESVFMPNLGMEFYYNNEAYNVSQSLNNLLFTIINDNYLAYTNTFNGIHALRLRGGFRWQTNDYQEDLGTAMNSNENDQYTNLGSGDNQLRFISGASSKWTWLSNYYSASYVFRDKYLVDLALSADFSSRVGKEAEGVLKIGNAPFGIFYNVGGAWRISNESFMSGITGIDDLKFRLNFGTSGNDDIGTTNSFSYYSLQLFRETSGMIPGGFANEMLKFETSRQISSGLDLGVMENRLRLSIDYYMSSTRDLLIFEQLPSYMGYDIFPSNNASLTNNGVELTLDTRLIQGGSFTLDLGLSLSHYNSLITSMPDDEVITSLQGGAEIINRVGEQANSYYGYEFNGVFATSEEAALADLYNDKGIPFRAGDAIFSDISGPGGSPDHVINEYDKIIMGSSTPDLFGGLALQMKYKRFGFDMLWQFVYGSENYNHLRYLNERMSDISNQSAAVLNRWIYQGQETMIPRSSWDDPLGNSAFSTRWIEDGSYLRLKHITVSYTIPESVLFFRNLTVFLTGSNLLTFSNYLSYDPEFSYSFDPMMQGIDFGLMPMARTVMAGFKFGL